MTRPAMSLPRNSGESIRFRIIPPFCPVALQWHSFSRLKDTDYWLLQCPKRRVRDAIAATGPGSWEGECAACEYWSQDLRYNPSPEIQKDIKPYQRYYYKVLDRSVREPTPTLLPVTTSIHKTVIGFMIGGDDMDIEPLGDITNMNTGRDLTVWVKRLVAGFPEYGVKYHDFGPALDSPQMCDFFADWPDNFDDLYRDDAEKIKEIIEYTYKGRRPKQKYRSIDAPWFS